MPLACSRLPTELDQHEHRQIKADLENLVESPGQFNKGPL